MDHKMEELFNAILTGQLQVNLDGYQYSIASNRYKAVSFQNYDEMCEYIYNIIHSTRLYFKEVSVLNPMSDFKKDESYLFPRNMFNKEKSLEIERATKKELPEIIKKIFSEGFSSIKFIAGLEKKDRKRVNFVLLKENIDDLEFSLNYTGDVTDNEYNRKLF